MKRKDVMTTTTPPKKTSGRPRKMTRQEKQEWKAVVQAAYGSLAWVDYSVDEYLREKYAETARENKS